MLKKVLKNQKGLTLIELLAVVVILGIIAAIAVPSIGNVMNNAKKDAHLANAQELANAARLYVTTENKTVAAGGLEIGLYELIANGYMSEISDPSNKGTTYHKGASGALTTKVVVKPNGGSYTFNIVLYAADGTKKYIDAVTTPQDITELVRDDVTL